MNAPLEPAACYAASEPGTITRKKRAFWLFCGAILAVYSPVLWALGRHLLTAEFHQYIFLIPFLGAFLFLTNQKRHFPPTLALPSRRAAAVTAALALSAAASSWHLHTGHPMSNHDWLSWAMVSLLLFLLSAALLVFGWPFLRPYLFAIGFCALAIPLPDFLFHGASAFLQHASADAADFLFRVTGTPFHRDGYEFSLPGLDIRVAEQCSGFRSTFMLFIASLLAGEVLLRRRIYKLLLVAAVLPIAIARNGFRVAVLCWLTIHVDSRIIDGPLHHHGGPIFFVLSMIPFLLVLAWLRRRESKEAKSIRSEPTVPA